MTGKRLGVLFGLISLLVFSPAMHQMLLAQTQGPQKVPVPAPVKRLPTSKKWPLPPVPRFKDVAKEVGLTVSHVAAPEARYVIDSTSGGAGLFDCDDDGRLDALLINGSTVDRLRAGGDPM